MKKIMLTLLLGCVQYLLYAQNLTLYDIDSGEPLEGAMLVNENTKSPLLTNEKGQVDISSFAGSTRIQIKMDGYQLLEMSYFDIEESGFKVGMISSSVRLETVVMAATKWDQSSTRNTQSVNTISRRDVSLQNPQTAADVLGLSGRVFIQKSQQGGGSPMIRGFGTNRLLYTVDGVRMNTAIFRSGNIQNVISLDPFATERTEVLFGPSSVMYGSDAIGAVMSFQTLKPEFSHTGEPSSSGQAVFRYSTANNEKTGHFDVQLGAKKWAILTSISANDFGDLRMGSHGPDEYLRPYFVVRQDSQDVVAANPDPRVQKPSAYQQINLMQKIRVVPAFGWEIKYDFHYSETSSYGRYDRHLRTRNGLPRYGQWDYGPQKWMMNHLTVEHHNSTPAFDKMTVHLAHQAFEESRIDRNFNSATLHVRTEKVDAYSLNADFLKNLGTHNRLQYGVEGVLNKVRSAGIDEDILLGTSQIGPSRYPQSMWYSGGIYLTDQWTVSEKISVTAGVRYNLFALDATFDTTFYHFPFSESRMRNSALTGSAGVTYRPGPTWLLAASVSSAFRSPNVDDMGKVFDSAPGTITVPNPDLRAEYAYCGEISAAKVFGDWLKVNGNVYFTQLRNLMVRRDFALNGLDSILYDGSMSQVMAVQNGGTGHVFGLEGGIELKLADHLYLASQVNWMQGNEELDNGDSSPLRHVTPWYGTTRLSYIHSKLTMQAYAQYSGGMAYVDLPVDELDPYLYAINADGNPYSPGWYTVNFKSTVSVTDAIKLSAGLENIMDVRFRPLRSGICAPGRNFILSVRTVF